MDITYTLILLLIIVLLEGRGCYEYTSTPDTHKLTCPMEYN